MIEPSYKALCRELARAVITPYESVSKEAQDLALYIARNLCKDEKKRNELIEKAQKEVEQMLWLCEDENEERPN